MARQNEKKSQDNALLFSEAGNWALAKELGECFTVEHLKALVWTFSGERVRESVKKGELCSRIATYVTFSGQADYDRFFTSLPDTLQRLILLGCFHDEVDCVEFEKRWKVKILVSELDRFTRKISLNPAERVQCFVPENDRFVRLPEPFRSIFRQYAPRPPEWDLSTVAGPHGAVWSNEREMAETLPLLLVAVTSLINDNNRYSRTKKPALKSELKILHARSGLATFPLSAETGLDPVGLFIPILAALHAESTEKPADIDVWVKSTINRFFFREKVLDPFLKVPDWLAGSWLEFSALGRHLGDESRGEVFDEYAKPASRETFHWLLKEIAPSGAWYSVDSLLATLEARGKSMSFLSRERERWPLFLHANSISIQGLSLKNEYGGSINISGPLHREVVYRPLLKAYCYVLAILGILEISETSPATPVLRKGKREPISCFDALECIRVTDYGRWLLGVSSVKPERVADEFEAIADKELLLVTFRGKSLERKLFLEEIGDRLGDERFRISEVSFTRGCKQARDVKARIARFTELIEKSPSPRWLAFFRTVSARVGLFSRPERALLFDLSGLDPSIGATIFGDPRLAEIVIRAECNKLVIPESRYRQFIKLLGDHGFVTPEIPG